MGAEEWREREKAQEWQELVERLEPSVDELIAKANDLVAASGYFNNYCIPDLIAESLAGLGLHVPPVDTEEPDWEGMVDRLEPIARALWECARVEIKSTTGCDHDVDWLVDVVMEETWDRHFRNGEVD